jgi:glutaredoxin
MSLLTMYSRPGCGLCDEAREVIESVMSTRADLEFDFEEISIEGDDALELEYGIRIPVVLIDGEEFCEYRVEPADLAEALS